jgi:hypothetical protein
MEHILSVVLDFAAVGASLWVKIVGFPRQLKAGSGMVSSMSGGMAVSYSVWVLQGAVARDWALVASSVLGVAGALALLVQSRRHGTVVK